MPQTTLCVPLEVKPESCSQLSALITDLRLKVVNGRTVYELIASQVPTLHFMSMSVFPHADYDPLFIIEANFDGTPGVYWGQIEATIGEELRAMLRCCKRPLQQDGPLYDAVTAPGSRSPVVPYFEARTQSPSVFHHGNRGLDRNRILTDEKLFRAVRDEIDVANGASPYRGLPAESARVKLRQALLPRFPWLSEPKPRRIGMVENIADYVRLLLFAALLLMLLSLPGLMLAPLLSTRVYLTLIAVAAIVVAMLVWKARHGLTGSEVRGSFPFAIFRPKQLLFYVVAILAYVIAATALLLPAVVLVNQILAWASGGAPTSFEVEWRPVARAVLLGLPAFLVTAALLVFRVRILELRDSSRDAPEIKERTLRQMVRREDWIAQNHMGSIVLIKPGVLRTIIIRAGHLGLGLWLRAKVRDGYLGSMRTIHFAHWAFLNNGSRLLFFSNFDHSWDSYLDDFIEKSAEGLTFAWGCGVGFPPTRFLIFDGAAHGRRFKNWALASRAVSSFWYSAYRELTVDQIERNHRIANGLRAESLSQEDATVWMRDL